MDHRPPSPSPQVTDLWASQVYTVLFNLPYQVYSLYFGFLLGSEPPPPSPTCNDYLVSGSGKTASTTSLSILTRREFPHRDTATGVPGAPEALRSGYPGRELLIINNSDKKKKKKKSPRRLEQQGTFGVFFLCLPSIYFFLLSRSHERSGTTTSQRLPQT